MVAPSQLAVEPSVKSLEVPEYDFQTQTRWNVIPIAGSHTNNSIQTFDNSGKPCDAQSDNND